MDRVWRHSWLRSSRPLWIALALLIALLSFGGYFLTSQTIRSDRDADAERRARAESVETQQILGRARAYVQGLSNVLASSRQPDQSRFATLAAGTAASVGLDDVLWVQQVPDSARRAYERRLGARITRLTSSGRVAPAPTADSYLPATFTSRSRPELRPGVDVSSFPGLADAVRDRATVFAVSASKAGSLGDEPGFYLLQSASFGPRRGFLAAFVPRGWFITTVGEDPRRIAVGLEGRRIEGQLDSVDATASFETLGRRWRIDVARDPPSSLQSTLPWLAFAWPLAVALIALLVGRAVMLRRRAEREAQDLFDRSTDLIGTAGFDGYFKRVNPAFSRTLGYPVDELVTRPYNEFVHPDDLQRSQEAFAEVLRGQEVIGFENRYVCADGSVRWIQWNVRPQVDEQVMYGVGRDVTESHLVEREFEELFNLSADLIFIAGFDGYIKRVNPAFEETSGFSIDQLTS
jgi:PAS domain S-box-containing protein